METLKAIRQKNNLTQNEAAKYLNISRRTYQIYESLNNYNNYKYIYMLDKLSKYNYIDEENGILSIDSIRTIISNILKNYDVSYCYLFGSYAKNKANEKSDVDLLIETTVTGLKFFGLIEELREALKKKVDLLTTVSLENSIELTKEILKDGVKIYG